MAGDSFKTVKSGDAFRPSAALTNAVIQHLRTPHAPIGGPVGSGSGGQSVTVRNVSGAVADRGYVMGISGVAIEPDDDLAQFARRPILNVTTPDDADHVGRFVILTKPLGVNAIGPAAISGQAVCQIDMTDAGHKFAKLTDADATKLTSCEPCDGAVRILWVDSGTGTLWGLVNLGDGAGGGSIRYGKPSAAFSSGVTITLDPCDVHGTDNGESNVTVYTQADQSSYSMTNSTTIPTSQIVPYVLGDDGNAYMFGTPIEIVTTYRVDGTNAKLQKKTRNVWVAAPGDESDWVDVHTGTDGCP